MPQLSDHSEPHDTAHVRAGAQRVLAASSLAAIACQVRAALDDAGLNVEVFFTVPLSGEALLTLATPTDPSNPDWTQANQIICGIVGKVIGLDRLRSRALPSAAADAPIEAADVWQPSSNPDVRDGKPGMQPDRS